MLNASYGMTGSTTEQLWSRHDVTGLVKDQNVTPAGRFSAELGYGLNSFGGYGVLTSYTGFERTKEESARHLGGRLKVGEDLRVRLESSLRDGAEDEHEIRLELSGCW